MEMGADRFAKDVVGPAKGVDLREIGVDTLENGTDHFANGVAPDAIAGGPDAIAVDSGWNGIVYGCYRSIGMWTTVTN